jgi:hypothetical protein
MSAVFFNLSVYIFHLNLTSIVGLSYTELANWQACCDADLIYIRSCFRLNSIVFEFAVPRVQTLCFVNWLASLDFLLGQRFPSLLSTDRDGCAAFYCASECRLCCN